MLNDSSPYQDDTGRGATAQIKSGSGTPVYASPVVSSGIASLVVSDDAQIEFASPVFVQGQESREFALEAWVFQITRGGTTGVQQILSHNNQYDGITISDNVVKFTTKYLTAPDAVCSYDVKLQRGIHIVAVHNASKNELYVNGVLVDTVELTDEQKQDSFIATDGKLYSGKTTTDQELALNAVAIYPSISPANIKLNYLAGRMFLSQNQVAPAWGGEVLSLTGTNEYFNISYVGKADFSQGLKNNINISEDLVSPVITGSVSEAGSLTIGIPIDSTGITSIYGVYVDWSGEGVTVEAKLNAGAWTAVTQRRLLTNISNGFDPTGADLELKFSFPGGITDDTSYLEGISVIGFKNNLISKSATRNVDITHPSVVIGDYEPIEYRQDNGVVLVSSTLTISPESSTSPPPVRTVEFWIKPHSGTPSISTSGTKYRNGVADATLPIGEWSLVHIVAPSDVVSNITVTGNCTVGQVALYQTALTADDILNIFLSYTGFPIERVEDENEVIITEPASPVEIYAYDWSILGGGG